jgi:glycosyltransferase involved in cell wall biosynthesis
MILAKDAADTIQRCIDSVISSGCFTEIHVLLDDKTTDQTGAILLRYMLQGAPVKVYTYHWRDPQDFAAARNHQIAQLRTPYALWLDVDEEIGEPGAIRGMLQRASGQAFMIWHVSAMSDGSEFRMYQPRLFPVKPGVFFECPVFERIDWSLKNQGIRLEMTDASIRHTGYTDDEVLRRKNERNLRILEHAAQNFQGGYEQTLHLFEQYKKLAGGI